MAEGGTLTCRLRLLPAQLCGVRQVLTFPWLRRYRGGSCPPFLYNIKGILSKCGYGPLPSEKEEMKWSLGGEMESWGSKRLKNCQVGHKPWKY